MPGHRSAPRRAAASVLRFSHASDSSHPTGAGDGPRPAGERRARGVVLLVGAALIVALIETEVLAYYWLPALAGLTYLAAAAAGRSRGELWGPGFVVTIAGLAVALWFRDGRPADSLQLLSLLVMALGLGGVLAALLAHVRGLSVSAMSVALPTLLVGAVFLLEQQGIRPFAGEIWFYAGLLAAWGLYELRPVREPKVRR